MGGDPVPKMSFFFFPPGCFILLLGSKFLKNLSNLEKRGTWQTFLKLEVSRITGCQGWKGPRNHLAHLLHFTTETQRPIMVIQLEAGSGQPRLCLNPLPLYVTSFSTFSRVSFSYKLNKGEAFSPEAVWAARNLWESVGICASTSDQGQSAESLPATRWPGMRSETRHPLLSVCKHQPLILQGSLRARNWEEACRCPRIGRILVWKAGDKGRAKNTAHMGWAAIHDLGAPERPLFQSVPV